jgi:hypothetical protein
LSHPNNLPLPGRPKCGVKLSVFVLLAASSTVFGLVPSPRAAAASSATTLTTTQQAQLKARRDKLEQDLASLRSDNSLTEDQKQKAFEKLEVAYASDIAAILTPAQRAALAAQMDEEGRLRKLRETEFTDVTRQILDLSTTLQKSLSKQQQQQIAKAKQDAHDNAVEINKDKSLTTQQHDAKITDVERQLEIRIEGIFTADQKANFDKIQSLEQRQIQLINGAKPAGADAPAPAK